MKPGACPCPSVSGVSSQSRVPCSKMPQNFTKCSLCCISQRLPLHTHNQTADPSLGWPCGHHAGQQSERGRGRAQGTVSPARLPLPPQQRFQLCCADRLRRSRIPLNPALMRTGSVLVPLASVTPRAPASRRLLRAATHCIHSLQPGRPRCVMGCSWTPTLPQVLLEPPSWLTARGHAAPFSVV